MILPPISPSPAWILISTHSLLLGWAGAGLAAAGLAAVGLAAAGSPEPVVVGYSGPGCHGLGCMGLCLNTTILLKTMTLPKSERAATIAEL